jgi:putative salt-induced outer membrane protein YdiY
VNPSRLEPATARRALACVLVVVCLAPAAQGSTILNTLGGYNDREPGWSGGVDVLFSAEGGNSESIELESGFRAQWRGARDRVRMQSSVSYEETAGVETEREVVAHVRHNRDLSDDWATVTFGQIQHNPFQRLQRRWLIGAGLRYDLYDDERGSVRIGVTPMLEIEKLQDGGDAESRGRLSTFVHVGRQLREDVRLDLTGFWQPTFRSLADARATGNATLAIDVIGSVDLKVGVEVEYDAKPPEGVENTDWETMLGLGLTF